MLGLLVSSDGCPLSYNIFNGSQYEGRTMTPIIDDFVQRFSLTNFIVVADAGLLSRKNIALLKQAGYKFILGGRIKKESKPVQDWVLSLQKDTRTLHETTINGEHSVIPLKLQSAPHHILRKGLVCFLAGFGEFTGVGAS